MEEINTYGLSMEKYLELEEKKKERDRIIKTKLIEAQKIINDLDNELTKYSSDFNAFPEAVALNATRAGVLNNSISKLKTNSRNAAVGLMASLGLNQVEDKYNVYEMTASIGADTIDTRKLKTNDPALYDDLVRDYTKPGALRTSFKAKAKKTGGL